MPAMQHDFLRCDRRAFIRQSAALAAGLSFSPRLFGETRSKANVAIVSCKTYGPEVKAALAKSFDLIGGIQKLVRDKTVTVKLNLTGTNFQPFQGRPVGETYMTHPATVMALTALLFDAGAKRVRLVESTQSKAALESTLDLADWDVHALSAMGKMEFENTRNLGVGKSYSHLKVPGAGYMFSAFDFNHAYEDTDVMISLAKLKRHVTAGVTLSMKNMFGITPNSIYGEQSGDENATAGRGPLHNAKEFPNVKLPNAKSDIPASDPTARVPRIIVDVCAARPIHLSIIDGITAMTGGEGPWTGQVATLKLTNPGLLITGFNPVSTDAVATAVMGYDNPRAERGVHPFDQCDNHLLLAEKAGLGSADLTQIDVRGLTIVKARYSYG